jgi:hypothetical protein
MTYVQGKHMFNCLDNAAIHHDVVIALGADEIVVTPFRSINRDTELPHLLIGIIVVTSYQETGQGIVDITTVVYTVTIIVRFIVDELIPA